MTPSRPAARRAACAAAAACAGFAARRIVPAWGESAPIVGTALAPGPGPLVPFCRDRRGICSDRTWTIGGDRCGSSLSTATGVAATATFRGTKRAFGRLRRPRLMGGVGTMPGPSGGGLIKDDRSARVVFPCFPTGARP